MNSGEKYVDAINYVLNNNLMVGKGADKNSRKIYFGTNDILLREEFVQVLYNYEGKPNINGATVPYTDVEKKDWYYNAIVWAYTNNVVKGYSEEIFGVGDKLTREQLVQMLYNYASYRGYLSNYDSNSVKGLSGGFVDSSSISPWAKPAMDWAVSQGVMSYRKDNYGSSLLAPTSPASRAESADMIKNFVKIYK